MTKIILPKLSYKIIGALYSVFNQLGYGYQEKYYQRALTEELDGLEIDFQRELPIKLKYKGKNIGRYFVDFLIEDKVILEIKVANDFYQKDINQVLAYLKSKDLKLGILAIFTKSGIKYKRIVN